MPANGYGVLRVTEHGEVIHRKYGIRALVQEHPELPAYFRAAKAHDWPFFAAMLDDIEMLMAKSDLAIFERYSRLAGPLHDAFCAGIAAEFERTADTILSLRNRSQLLQDDYRLRLSIRLRNPYVNPISLLPVEMLQR